MSMIGWILLGILGAVWVLEILFVGWNMLIPWYRRRKK